MTQTSKASSLHDLLDQAYDLHTAIDAAMEAVQNHDGPEQPDEWMELHTVLKAVGITCDQLGQMIRRQDAASQPIPYTLADGQ